MVAQSILFNWHAGIAGSNPTRGTYVYYCVPF
jgi:hypothetical protein